MKLNLGGGANWSSSGWTNLDIDLGHNLRQDNPLPYPDNSVDAIFCSHVLEHMPVDDARRLITACYRVLRPEGLLRLVVPDCQKFAEEWLKGCDAIFTENRFLTPHFSSFTHCFQEMGGNASSLNEPSIIQHYHFWDHWTLAWLLVRCGFGNVWASKFSESRLEELRAVAIMGRDGMPLNGFDNPYTAPISAFLEASKSCATSLTTATAFCGS